MSWVDDTNPDVNFIWGDMVTLPDNNTLQQVQGIATPDPSRFSLNLSDNQDLAALHTQQKAIRHVEILNSQYAAAGIQDHPATEITSQAYTRGRNGFGQNSLFS